MQDMLVTLGAVIGCLGGVVGIASGLATFRRGRHNLRLTVTIEPLFARNSWDLPAGDYVVITVANDRDAPDTVLETGIGTADGTMFSFPDRGGQLIARGGVCRAFFAVEAFRGMVFESRAGRPIMVYAFTGMGRRYTAIIPPEVQTEILGDAFGHFVR